MPALTVRGTDLTADDGYMELAQHNKQAVKRQSGQAKSILIIFATRYGHTARIVQQIVNALNLTGHQTIAVHADRDELPKLGGIARDVSCIILGGPIYFGRFPRILSEFVEQSRELLNSIPTAFFSVSLAAAYDDGKKVNGVHETMDQFFAKNRWQPCHKASFAGALLYTHYGSLVRFIMRRISQSAGGDTNIHRDYVYTDWSKISEFARKIDSMIQLAVEQTDRTASH